MSLSYRVAYRREGGRLLTRHYETYEAAQKKYRRIKSIEEVKLAGGFDDTSLGDMPPLVELRLEHRQVQPWEKSPYQPQISDGDLHGARSYADDLTSRESQGASGDGVPF